MTGRASQRRFRITALFAAAALALSGAAGADMAVGGGGKPPKPTGLTVAATATSLTLSWNPAGGAASYGLYLDTQPVGTTTATSWTFSNLACGTTHQLGVDTITGSGRHSSQATTSGTTGACGGNPPVVSSFSPTSGPVGTGVTINGASFTGATSVTFNGVAAALTVNSSSQITTTVPSVATTGPIAVKTPAGSTTSATSFTVSTPPPPGLANVFVAPPSSAGLGANGSDSDGTNCTRFGTSVTAPPGGLGRGCATFQKAYQLAQPGDTVYLNWNGAWPITLGIGPSGNKTSANRCNYPSDVSGCINFTPAPGLSPSLTPSGTTSSALRICANYIELSNVTFNQRTYVDGFGDTVTTQTWGVGAGDSSCMPSNAPPHDIFIKNVVSNGQAGAAGGSSNVYVLGGAIQNVRDLAPEFGGVGNNGTTAGAHNNTIDGVTFTNIYGDDSAHHHMECVHVDVASGGAPPVSDSITIKNSSFVGCKTGPAGPVYSIRFETDATGSSATNNLVENNAIDAGAPISFNCHANKCAVTGNVVRFNTITGSGSALALNNDCSQVSGQTCTVSGNLFYGNLVGGGCPSNSTIYAAGWTETYNVWSGSGGIGTICSGDATSAFNAPISLTGPTGRLANCTQVAGNFIAPQKVPGIPKTDIIGNGRPKNYAVDAGANEDC